MKKYFVCRNNGKYIEIATVINDSIEYARFEYKDLYSSENIEKYGISFEEAQKILKKAKQKYRRIWKKYKNEKRHGNRGDSENIFFRVFKNERGQKDIKPIIPVLFLKKVLTGLST